MKVSLEQAQLLHAVQVVQPIGALRSTLPALSHILLQALEGKLVLSATDLEVSIQTEVEAKVSKTGEATSPGKTVMEVVKKMPAERADLEMGGKQQLTFRSGTYRVSLPGLPREDFPILPEFKEKNSFVVEREKLLEVFSKTSYASSVEETRYVLTGVLLVVEEGKIKSAATDGRRLSTIIRDLPSFAGPQRKVIIPAKAIRELERILSADQEQQVRVSLMENQVGFRFSRTVLISRVIDGNFPNYEQVIPKKSRQRIEMKAGDLLALTERVAVAGAEKSGTVKFSLTPGRLKASTSSAVGQEGEDELPVDYQGEEVDISFNPAYIMDALKRANGDSVFLELTDSASPVVIRPAGDATYINVIMPMRT